MTDREILELAAKAAGIEGHWHEQKTTFSAPTGWLRLDGNTWNPLTYDGDALRLLVALGLLVDTNGMLARVSFPYEEPLAYEAKNADPYAATRRAITRAAAEVGRSME